MDYVAIADRVAEANDSHSAIIGHTFIGGVGRVSLFSDEEAREAWIKHVGPLRKQGQFIALSSGNLPINVVWGQR
jgi:hypothetical protein